MNKIAVSTCTFGRGVGFAQIERVAIAESLMVEFSSGFPYEENLDRKFISAKCRKLIHNYFPAPQVPFVLNLASLNEETWNASLQHGRQGLKLAHEAGIPFYSIHAGFCVEPKPKELGKPLNHHVSAAPRDQYWQRFLSALKILLSDADKYDVSLFVENNVVSKENVAVPLLCAEADECQRLFIDLPNPRLGLLLDTAHLKVSANTLSFDAHRFVQQLKPHIRALHHSDNDGWHDTNERLPVDYWFSRHMPDYQDCSHVLEIENLTVSEMHQQIALLEQMMTARVATHD